MKTYLLAQRHVPEFVRAENPAFIEFIKAYYKWFEDEYSIGRIESLVDVDDTIDDFLVYFRKQLDIYNVTTPGLRYLKDVRSLYTRKGTSEGISLLLRVMFDQYASVIHPWDQTFKTSVGTWTQDVSILTKTTSGDVTSLAGNLIVVTDASGRTYQTYVKDINIRPSGVVELFISRFDPQSILTSYQTTDGTIAGTVYRSTVTAVVETGGRGYRVGQVFAVESSGGSGTLVKVKSVDAQGAIKTVELIAFGTGYLTEFNILISPTQTLTAADLGSSIQLGGFTYISDDNISTQNEQGLIVRHDYTVLSTTYVADPTYVGELVGDIQSQPNISFLDSGKFATIRFKVGSLCVYPGFYRTSDNIIGDELYIQDSKYYQAYSYVTQVEDTLSKYGGLLRAVMHPTGTKHFGDYRIVSDFQVNTRADASLNIFSKTDAIRELVSVDDVFTRVGSFIRDFSDSVGVTDESVTAVQYNRPISDSVMTDDNNIVIIQTTTLTDTFSVTELIAFIATRIYSDTATVSDNVELTSHKYPTQETVTTVDVGGVYRETYVIQAPAYWEAGYLEDEYLFT